MINDEEKAPAEEPVEVPEEPAVEEPVEVLKGWVPKTRLGHLVKEEKIKNIDEILEGNMTIKEPEIVDALLGELKEDVIEINMVQRMSDSGRRTRFAVTAIVGNGNGYIGIGRAHSKEVGSAIRKGVERAKMNIMHVDRGCGSWQCGCNGYHSVPFKVRGKSGSAEITILPGPKGLGIVSNDVAKRVLTLAGIKDVWTFTQGETRTKVSMAYATYNALKAIVSTRGVI